MGPTRRVADWRGATANWEEAQARQDAKWAANEEAEYKQAVDEYEDKVARYDAASNAWQSEFDAYKVKEETLYRVVCDGK